MNHEQVIGEFLIRLLQYNIEKTMETGTSQQVQDAKELLSQYMQYEEAPHYCMEMTDAFTDEMEIDT